MLKCIGNHLLCFASSMRKQGKKNRFDNDEKTMLCCSQKDILTTTETKALSNIKLNFEFDDAK